MKNIKKEEAEQLKAKLESGKLLNILQSSFLLRLRFIISFYFCLYAAGATVTLE